MQPTLLTYLATWFEYPRENTDPPGREPVVDPSGPGPAADALKQFTAALAGLTLEQRQELYIQTFDLNPLCSLEVGWQLYGDHYERGRFLAEMRGDLRRFDIAETAELPDHLTHVFALLAHLPEEQARRFVTRFAAPAVDKMYASLRDTDNPYRFLLRAAQAILVTLSIPAGEEVPT